MYYRVADPDSYGVLNELAPDVARRSLESEAALPVSSVCASGVSVTSASTRSAKELGLGIARLLHHSESPRTRSSHRVSALHHLELAQRCRHDEFATAGPGQEAG
jgi:hypothetical protein